MRWATGSRNSPSIFCVNMLVRPTHISPRQSGAARPCSSPPGVFLQEEYFSVFLLCSLGRGCLARSTYVRRLASARGLSLPLRTLVGSVSSPNSKTYLQKFIQTRHLSRNPNPETLTQAPTPTPITRARYDIIIYNCYLPTTNSGCTHGLL